MKPHSENFRLQLHRWGVILIVLALGAPSSVAAQAQDSARFFIAVGVGMPSGPQTFYDFWDPGASIGGGFRFLWRPAYYYGIEAEMSYFGLNRGRYVKALNLPAGAASVGGGTATLVSLGVLLGSTTTDPREYVQASGDVSLCLLTTFTASSTGTFSGYTTESPGVIYGALQLSGAGRIEVTTFGAWHVAIEGRARFGLTGTKLANTNFSSVRLYCSRAFLGL